MFKRKPANKYYQKLTYYESEYEPRQTNLDFDTEREILVKENDKTFAERRFERINNMVAAKACINKKDLLENKKIFIYGFKHIKTDKIDNYIFFGCESDVFNENNKLFNFWSNKFVNKQIEMSDFKTTRWPFLTLVKRNNIFKIESIVCK